MPSLIVLRKPPNLFCTQSRSSERETRKARVAPMVLAKETSIVPTRRPNSAPPSKVRNTAPGRERAVEVIYTAI